MCRAPIECAEKTGLQREVETPNISGALHDIYGGPAMKATGAFSGDVNPATTQGEVDGRYGLFTFSANNYSSRYNGDKMQVSALQTLACIRT